MRTPLGKVKWLVGSLKLAQTQPPSARYAKKYVIIWGALLAVVLVNAAIGLLVAPMSAFMFGFTLVSVVIYAVFLKWAIDGMSYAARMEARRQFDEIVKHVR